MKVSSAKTRVSLFSSVMCPCLGGMGLQMISRCMGHLGLVNEHMGLDISNELNMFAPNPTLAHNPQDLSPTIYLKHDLHPPNTLLSGDASKDCSFLLSNNRGIRLRHP